MSDWKSLDSHSSEVLIGYFQDEKKDVTVRDDAFLALMFRFRKDLVNKCEIICKRRGFDIDVARLIAERTFTKYGRSKNFRVEKCTSSCIETCFKIYLYGISRNELKDYYNEEEKKRKGQYYYGTENIITEIPSVETENMGAIEKLIHETILGFPYSHQVIFLTYKAHEKDGVNLPKSLMVKLRDHLGGITQSTVRAYKKEVIDKIETAVKSFKLGINE